MPEPDSKPKSILVSKTAWWNGIAISVLGYLISAAENGNLPETLLPYAAIITAAGNLILRLLTKDPIKPLFVIGFLAVSLFTGSAMAAPPEAIITGPTGGIPGDILVLDASESKADFFDWEVTPELPDGRKTILPLEGGKKCLVTSVPGTYTAFLAAGNAEGIDLKKWTVKVGGDSPTPGPGPGPTPPHPGPNPNPPNPVPPTPTPDVPDGKFAIAKLVRDWARQVNTPSRSAECVKLADGADAISARISAGTLEGPREILAAVLEANIAAVGHSLEWQAFGKKFEARLRELYEASRLQTDADWAVLFQEMAVGLRAAA
ncbi:MAG: hypothetical protein CMJ46_03195 [Planctomyces sp.]|nr:hypothetical protein [Planctomyces sp.]